MACCMGEVVSTRDENWRGRKEPTGDECNELIEEMNRGHSSKQEVHGQNEKISHMERDHRQTNTNKSHKEQVRER